MRRRRTAIGFGLVVIVRLTLMRLADPCPLRVAREIRFDRYRQMA